MSAEPVRIWLETSHHQAFRAGGWAFVRADGAEVTGAAGGDRRAEAERIALEGLIAAVKGLDVRPVQVMTASPLIAAIPARIRAAAVGQDTPAENLAQWAQVSTALAGGVEIVQAAAAAGTPTAFAAGWAELARDKAKTGPFRAAIPKTNLAKAGV